MDEYDGVTMTEPEPEGTPEPLGETPATIAESATVVERKRRGRKPNPENEGCKFRSVPVNDDTWNHVKAIADQRGTSTSAVVRCALLTYFDFLKS